MADNKRFPRFIILWILLIATVLPVSAGFHAGGGIADAIDGIFAYQVSDTGSRNVQDWFDGTLAPAAGSASDWYVLALLRYQNIPDASRYREFLQLRAEGDAERNASTRLRNGLLLLASGSRDEALLSGILEGAVGRQGVMSYIFALHLLNNGVTTEGVTRDGVLDSLLALRKEDGGFAVMGSYGDVDVTAMALQALAPCRDRSDAAEAIEAALSWLGSQQLEDGGYAGFGQPNPESAAQVILALTALDLDPETDERFLKNGLSTVDAMLSFRRDDGGFAHEAEGDSCAVATAQAALALVGLWRYRSGLSPLYQFDQSDIPVPGDEAETQSPAETEPAVPEFAADEGGSEKKPFPVKLAGTLAIAAVCVFVALFLWFRGKRNVKSYLAVLLIGGALLAFWLVTDFRSAGDYYGAPLDDNIKAVGSVTLSIRCDTVAGADSPYIPADGVMLPATVCPIAEGDTVYDVLIRAARSASLTVESAGVVIGPSEAAYIVAIGHLSEFDFGDLSGWVYQVNGISPSVGCGAYVLSDGDLVEWHYSLTLGADVP